MLRDVVGTVGVLVPVKDLSKNRRAIGSIIASHLLTRLSQIKVCECGYLLSVTKLLNISRGQIPFGSHHIAFTVEFRCRTFLPVQGEIMNGVVHRIMRHGVFLRSGPMNIIYLSLRLMPNYHFVPGENPAHVREDMSRVEIGVVVRFMVYAVRWVEDDELKEARVLASIDGDGLGPLSLNGLDGVEL
ncbi:DNA-directed RNA polymerase V subunit 7 [Striga hermonthica]|uniref:DNA-directed RNA polymerase subunit n=1 Tax=Striga hermonthica TaxID=68872 RepID=A0A9N7R1F9_STRHE|nr:DNA-directed RNA polymerase V subunit 7 [Striga hermonthica]